MMRQSWADGTTGRERGLLLWEKGTLPVHWREWEKDCWDWRERVRWGKWQGNNVKKEKEHVWIKRWTMCGKDYVHRFKSWTLLVICFTHRGGGAQRELEGSSVPVAYSTIGLCHEQKRASAAKPAAMGGRIRLSRPPPAGLGWNVNVMFTAYALVLHGTEYELILSEWKFYGDKNLSTLKELRTSFLLAMALSIIPYPIPRIWLHVQIWTTCTKERG